MITIDDLAVRYGQVAAVSGLSLAAANGTTVGLVGPNGSGKSSALRAILGALKVSRATVFIDGDDATTLSSTETARRLAVVAQEETTGLPLTVSESVLLGRSVHVSGWSNYSPDDKQAAEASMITTGVLHLRDRSIDELSGGERQRVLIARALAQSASHLLLDEPTNHLDVRYQHEILGLVHKLRVCSIVVLHDLNLAARYCDEVVLLDHGKVVAAGAPADVFTPANLEPIYRITVARVDLDGVVQLLFNPRAS